MKTTLNEIRKHEPCQPGWEKLLRHLNKTKPDDEPLDLLTVLESNGLGHTLWLVDRLYDQKQRMKLSALFVKKVHHLLSEKSVQALEDFYRYSETDIAEEELIAVTAALPWAWAFTYPSETAESVAYIAKSSKAANLKMKAKQVEILRKFLEETR
jgi:hypothetical protein